MACDFSDEDYGQRWQSQTVMFMLKQHQGDALTACSRHARNREMALMAVTHNILICHECRALLQGSPDTVFWPASGPWLVAVGLVTMGMTRAMR